MLDTAVATISILVTAVCLRLLLPWLRVTPRLLAVPNDRSSHIDPTPTAGGLAVVAGLFAGVVAGEQLTGDATAYWLLIPLGALAGLGMWDDWVDLSVRLRLVVQALVGAASVTGLLLTSHSGVLVLVLGIAVGSFWFAGYTNAFNFMDGINGISAIHAGLAGVWFTALGIGFHHDGITVAGIALAASSLTFLPWNLPHAKVFMGNVGSYVLGSAIALVVLDAVLHGVPVLLCVAPTLVYLLDTGLTLVRRVNDGYSWHAAHREHVYQRLVQLGLPHAPVAWFAAAMSTAAVIGCTAVTMGRAYLGAALLMAAAAAYLAAPAVAATATSTGSTTSGSQRALTHSPVVRSNSKLWPKQRSTPPETTAVSDRSSPE